MPYMKRAAVHLDIVAAFVRLAIEDEEVSPVDAVRCESLLIGWKNDAVIVADIASKETG